MPACPKNRIGERIFEAPTRARTRPRKGQFLLVPPATRQYRPHPTPRLCGNETCRFEGQNSRRVPRERVDLVKETCPQRIHLSSCAFPKFQKSDAFFFSFFFSPGFASFESLASAADAFSHHTGRTKRDDGGGRAIALKGTTSYVWLSRRRLAVTDSLLHLKVREPVERRRRLVQLAIAAAVA